MQVRLVRTSPVCAAGIASVLFLLPLLGSPALGAPGPWVGAVAAWLILVTQPAVDPRTLCRRTGPDKGSAAAIYATMIATQLAAALENRLSWRPPLPMDPVGLVPGLAAVLVGLSLRVWSIQTLGRSFTSTVQVTRGQAVVRSGPYARVRHPSYAGALLVALGTVLLLRSGVGFALLVLAVLPAYRYRIRVEEKALVEELGEAYLAYQREVPALVPVRLG